MTKVHLIRYTEQPRCFTRVQWLIWREAARNPLCGTPVHHCTDCTPEHQADMRGQALCDNPFGEATRDHDGFIQITPPTPAKESP